MSESSDKDNRLISPEYPIGIQSFTMNFASLYGGRMIEYFFGFIFMVYCARELGVATYGTLRFTLSLTSFFFVTADFGLGMLIVREVARLRGEPFAVTRLVTAALVLKVILLVATVILMIMSIFFLHIRGDALVILILLAISVALNTFAFFFQRLFQGIEQMAAIAISRVLFALPLCGIGIYVLFTKPTLFNIGVVYIIANLISLAYCVAIYLKKFHPPVSIFSRDLAVHLLKLAMPFGPFALFSVVYFQIDIIMIEKIRGSIEVGIYGAAFRLIITILFFTEAFMGAIYPRMSRFFQEDRKSLWKYFRHSCWIMYLTGLPATVGLFFVSQDLNLLLFGHEYAASGMVLLLLSPLIFLRFIGNVPATLLTASNLQHTRLYIVISASVVNIGLNLWLIPLYGYYGAIITTLVVNVILTLVYFYISIRMGFEGEHYLERLIRPTIAVVGMSLLLFFMRDCHVMIRILAGAAAYISLLFALKSFTPDEMHNIRTALGMFKLRTRKGKRNE